MIRSSLRRYLAAPVRADYAAGQRARILHVMLLATALGVLPMAALNLTPPGGFAPLLLAGSGLSLLGVYLNHHGRYGLAALLLLTLIYVATFYTIIDGAGFSDPGVVALPVLVFFVGVLFDKSRILAATGISILSVVVLFLLARTGLMELAQTPEAIQLVSIAILVAGTGVVAWVSADLRDKTLADLISRELRFRTLFEGSTDGIFIMEGDRFIDANAGAFRMFGVRREQIVGQTPYDFSPPSQPNGQPSRGLALEKIQRAVQLCLEGRPVLLAVVRDLTQRKLAEQAAQETRQRLARELHDAVSQTLWSASLIADVLPELWEQDQEKGRDRLRRLRQLTRGALAEMRALLLELRPSSLVERPLPELLQRLCEAVASRTGWPVSLKTSGKCALQPDVHIGFYRLAQEALNNATRHAAATAVEVELHCEPDRATLTVHDDGRGFDPSSAHNAQHLGLTIMRERATSIGAELTIQSHLGAGTQVRVRWPAERGSEHG